MIAMKAFGSFLTCVILIATVGAFADTPAATRPVGQPNDQSDGLSRLMTAALAGRASDDGQGDQADTADASRPEPRTGAAVEQGGPPETFRNIESTELVGPKYPPDNTDTPDSPAQRKMQAGEIYGPVITAVQRIAGRRARTAPQSRQQPETARAMLASAEDASASEWALEGQQDPPPRKKPRQRPGKAAQERPRRKAAGQADTETSDREAPPGNQRQKPDRTTAAEKAEPVPPPARGARPAESGRRGLLDIGQVQLSGNDIVIETVGNGILIYGNPDDVAILQRMIEELDEDIVPPNIKIVTLQNKNADEVAQVVEKVMEDISISGVDRPEERVTVSPLSTNILLIAAPDSKMDQVLRIIESVDKVTETLPEVELMTFQVQYRKPSEAAAELEEMINILKDKQKAADAPDFTIKAHDDLGTITVLGPISQEEKIRKLLETIDAAPKEGFGEIQLVLYPLKFNTASDMVDTLEQLLVAAEAREEAKEAIRRLRMLRAKDGEVVEELPPVDLEKPLKLIADDSTQSVIVATVEENVGPIGELINLLDTVPVSEEVALQIFNLRHADAKTVKDLIEELFDAGKNLTKHPSGQNRDAAGEGVVGQALAYEVAISADQRTNTLVVSGRPAQVALVTNIVMKLDQEAKDLQYPLQLVELEHSSAARLGKVISDLFEKRVESLEARDAGTVAVEKERVFITIDERTNSLVLSASPENYAEILRIVTKLDTPAEKLFEQIKIITCTNTSAADLASKIDDLWQRKADLRREAELPEDLPIIVPDQRSNALVVAASPEDFEAIEALVAQLEAQPLAPIAEIRLVTLEQNDATEVGDMLKQLFEERMEQRLAQGQEENPSDRVAVATDASTNTILIASSKENYDEMIRIIEAIDIQPDLEGVVRLFFLRYAVASDVAERIQDLFDQGLYSPQKGLESQLVEARQEIAVIDDPRSNSIVVSASKPNLSIIEKLIEQMDSPEPFHADSRTEVFPLEYADSVEVADMLQKMFEGIRSAASEPDLFPEPTILPDPRSNTLIVTGTQDALQRCRNLLAIVDAKAGAPSATFEIYQLLHASATRLAPMMQEMFDKRDEGSDQKRSPIFIQADESTNSLICTAARDDHAMITGLLRLLDKPSELSKQMEIFPLKSAKADEVADRLQTLFQSQAGTSSGPDRADAMAVEADVRTNALIVWAAPSQMENIRSIINKLDTTKPGQEMMVSVFRLQRARAEEFADVLDQTLNPDGAGDERAAIINFEDLLPDGSKTLRSLVRQDITITPDARTNSLMVMAPMGSMDMLESLIYAFDRLPPTISEIRLFQLTNADAEEVVQKLQDIFEEDGAGAGEVEEQLTIGTGLTDLEPGGLQMPLRFTADRRTNTVIAAGHEIDLRMVDMLVRMLDMPDLDERIVEVYKAQYIPAADIASAIKSFADEERDRLSDIEDETAAARRAERHVTAVEDEDSNSVLLGVSPRYYSHFMNMIHQIDRPPPQASIEVLIAEVSLDDRVGVGVEWAVQDLSFSKNAVIGPNGIVVGDNHDFVVGTDIGASAAGGSLGGFSFTITSEDFSFLFKALQADSLVELLSRPTILVENNEEANITIGDRVPIPRATATSEAGQISSTVEYENVGIILSVVPHINPDGFVNLEIRPEISQLTAASVQISEGFSANVISERSAETVVTVKDGETVVMGGLIQTREQETESKIPILGDIPLIGFLGRTTNVESRRTELMIVLTVNVIRSEDDAYAMSVKLRDQSGIIPERIKASPLMQGLRILPEETPGLEPLLEDETLPLRPGQLEPMPDRQLYGPNPEAYGPAVPQRVQIGSATKAEVYGPRLVGYETE